MKKIINLVFFDFDGCLCDSPLPDTGKQQWLEKHGIEYPHTGWWGRLESMCKDTFDIKLIPEQLEEWKRLNELGYESRILTSRQPKFKQRIFEILESHDVAVTDILLSDNRTKGERILDVIKSKLLDDVYVKHVMFFDDRNKEHATVELVRDEIERLGIKLDLVKIQSELLD